MNSSKNKIAELSNFKTRSEAMLTIINSGNTNLATELKEVLKNTKLGENHRWAAMQILATWQEVSSIEILISVMEDSKQLGSEARRALTRITGKDFGFEPEDWRVELLTPESKSENYKLLRKLFSGSYKSLTEDEVAKNFSINIKLPSGRHQQIIIDFNREDKNNINSIMLYSESGEVAPNSKNAFNNAKLIAKFGKPYIKEIDAISSYAKKYFVHKDNLNLNDLKNTVIGFAQEADDLEFKISGMDII